MNTSLTPGPARDVDGLGHLQGPPPCWAISRMAAGPGRGGRGLRPGDPGGALRRLLDAGPDLVPAGPPPALGGDGDHPHLAPGRQDGAAMYRDFDLFANGEPVGEAVSAWVLAGVEHPQAAPPGRRCDGAGGHRAAARCASSMTLSKLRHARRHGGARSGGACATATPTSTAM